MIALARVVLALALLASVACASRRESASPSTESGPRFGVYAGSHGAPDERRRSFRLWLHAELPDRIHAEVLGPIGGPRLIVDGGSGRLAVTIVDESTSFVGDASPSAIESVLGVRIALDDLVRGLLGGEVREGPYTWSRTPDRTGLPSRLEVVASSGRWISLRLKARRPIAGGAELGTGEPPGGTTRRSLGEIAGRDAGAFLGVNSED